MTKKCVLLTLLLLLVSCAQPEPTSVVDPTSVLLDACVTPSDPHIPCGLPPPAIPLPVVH